MNKQKTTCFFFAHQWHEEQHTSGYPYNTYWTHRCLTCGQTRSGWAPDYGKKLAQIALAFVLGVILYHAGKAIAGSLETTRRQEKGTFIAACIEEGHKPAWCEQLWNHPGRRR